MDNSLLIGLDEPAEWGKFSHKVDDTSNQWESHLVVEGMHCAACAFNVEKALKAINGVAQATVNATSKRARVTWSANQTTPSALMSALNKAGYSALPAHELFKLEARRKANRLMLWRVLVAGFCMMQVMMYAYPAYITGNNDMTPDIKNLLRWASWILTLPVLLFSASPFLTNAIHDIKNKQISMDLPVALGIIITFVVSTAATFDPDGWWGHEVYFDSLTMFVFFLLLGRWLELRMRDRTAGSLDVLMRRLPSTVERISAEGQLERVAVTKLVVGDRLRVLPGEAFPADGAIIEGETSVDEALLTGESKPIVKTVDDLVIAGSYNVSAPVSMLVSQLGNDTRYAQIVALMERASVDKPRLAILADRIAKPFLMFVILAAIGAAVYLWPVDHGRALMAAVAVLIVTCPCALSLATPAAMLTISGALARKGVLVQKMQAIEALTSVDTLVFDKTGTLSNEALKIGAVQVSDAYTANQALQLAAQLASHSLHPVSKAIAKASLDSKQVEAHVNVVDVKERHGLGLSADSYRGALKLGSAKFCGMDRSLLPAKSTAQSSVYLTLNDQWVATFEVGESVKSDAISSIQAIHQLGMRVELLSGDVNHTVQQFAKQVGITHAKGDCSPQGKLQHLQDLQSAGRKVAMVGDGLNDGPVLALAHTSIAMGHGVPLAQAQSDFIIMNDQVSMVVVLLLQAKRTMRIVKQNLFWAFVYNAVCVPLAIAGLLPAWLAGLGMAVSSLVVVINAMRLSQYSTQFRMGH